ncbi:MAG TPA: protein kinase [Chloroflexota bacterium]|nr:protein kinase [Chloroflexota bacterium]
MTDLVLNDRYRLIAPLGEGGMAVVYEANDLLLDRKVAVKLLRPQYATDPAFLARFQREAKAAARLSHPNVVAIYDVGSEGDTQYIVMELVEGRTLKELVEAEGPLAAAHIIDLGRQICEALDYAHRHQIVHRDVKSQNILVTGDGRAKIADFGIAVALGASSLTQAGFVVGSAHYFSPEQAQGEPTTPYSDIPINRGTITFGAPLLTESATSEPFSAFDSATGFWDRTVPAGTRSLASSVVFQVKPAACSFPCATDNPSPTTRGTEANSLPWLSTTSILLPFSIWVPADGFWETTDLAGYLES